MRYSDKGLRAFEGNDKYDRMTFFRDHFEKCRVDVKKMSMLELEHEDIQNLVWQVDARSAKDGIWQPKAHEVEQA